MNQSLNKTIHNPLILKKEESINKKLLNKPIIFVGMMGSGKTAIGHIIAKKLNRIFYDIDNIIEKNYGYSINEIFENAGEKRFREIEYEELIKIKNGNSVIATGGGAYINDKSHKLINKMGFTVWIKADSSTIIKRTKKNKNRPLLRGQDINNRIESLLKERNPIYKKAQLSVNTTSENKNIMCKNVINSIEKHLIDNSND